MLWTKGRTRYRFTGIHATLVLLRRFAYPNRWADINKDLKRSVSQCSTLFNDLIEFLCLRFDSLLSWNTRLLTVKRMQYYADCLGRAGCPLPGCWAFLDGTFRQSVRPWMFQEHLFSGHKRAHGYKFQGLASPDGLMVHLAGPYEGSANDQGMLNRTRLLDLLETQNRVAANEGKGPFVIYADGGYFMNDKSDVLIVPFVRTIQTEDELVFNHVMSKYRIVVEWAFGNITRYFKYIDYGKQLKPFLQPVGSFYRVAVLLNNLFVCLYGCVTSSRFECQPPSMEQYVAETGYTWEEYVAI